MSQIAQFGFLPRRLLIESRFRIGARRVGPIAARLAVKISSTSAPLLIVVLAAKTLLSRPGFDQRAIHGEVFIRHEPARLRFHPSEKSLGQVLVQQPIAVFAENGVIPYR